MTRFSCCRHCYHDPVFPTPGHDTACQRPDCTEGRQPYAGEEPDRGSSGCVFSGFHRSPDQVAPGRQLIPCGCGRQRITP